jgi:spermidine synthase
MADSHAQHDAEHLVHSCVDGDRVVEVVDDAETRSLYFGTTARQSAISLHAPDRLVLPYTRYMLSALLFCREPTRVLALGMGGAVLPQFLTRTFPGCEVDIVERRATVVKVARDYFHLVPSPILRTHVMDAGQFVRTWGGRPFDLVLVDLHDPDGMAPVVHEPDFFPACARLLARRGVASTNIWTQSGSTTSALVEAHRATFGEGHVVLPVRDRGNVILLGLPFPASSSAHAALEARARELEARLAIGLPSSLRDLSKRGRRAARESI